MTPAQSELCAAAIAYVNRIDGTPSVESVKAWQRLERAVAAVAAERPDPAGEVAERVARQDQFGRVR